MPAHDLKFSPNTTQKGSIVMKTKTAFATAILALLFAQTNLRAQQTNCPYPKHENLHCMDKATNCDRWIVADDCAGPQTSDLNCHFGLLHQSCCSGPDVYSAIQDADCGKGGGPLPALLHDLKNQPVNIRARVYVPTCRGSFEPVSELALVNR